MYVTWVYKDFEVDVFFPVIDRSAWCEVEISEKFQDEETGLWYAYADYVRKMECV
jgi:hypothetical protein